MTPRKIPPTLSFFATCCTALVLCVGTLGTAPASARESLRHKSLQPRALDLLPLGDLERQAFNAEHGVLIYRTQALNKRVKTLDGKLRKLNATRAKAKGSKRKKIDAQLGTLGTERKRLRLQVSGLMARLTAELVEDGMQPVLIPVMNAAPAGAGRLDRYSRSLVLLVPDLSPTQWRVFDRVVTQTDGAWHALTAQKERTLLALKQTELDKAEVRAVGSTFDRQLRLIDRRFWQLVDFTLTRDQRVQLWNNLPQRIRRKSQPVEHLYALPGLSSSQGTRLRSLMTEIEHESSPDNAAVKRINIGLKKKGMKGPERKALSKERGDAYKRLTELRRFAVSETRTILDEEQWLEYLSIPPRVSINDRRANNKRVFEGFKPGPDQQAVMQKIANDVRREKRAGQKRVAELRRKGGDYGPDSPQMMGMQMQMAGVQAEGARMQRDLIGRIFLEVMTPDQVTHWVMGHWGYKR